MQDKKQALLLEVAAIEAMQPDEGTIDIVLAFLRLQLGMGEVKFYAADQQPYTPAWNLLLKHAGPELNTMLLYYELSEGDMMATAKYIEAFRQLQYLVRQAVDLLP